MTFLRVHIINDQDRRRLVPLGLLLAPLSSPVGVCSGLSVAWIVSELRSFIAQTLIDNFVPEEGVEKGTIVE